jgi:hypothetical protein
MSFHVGQMVVCCIIPSIDWGVPDSCTPIKWNIYEIASIRHSAGPIPCWLELTGVSDTPCGQKVLWPAGFFRPMRPVNAAILASLLNLAHVPSGATDCDGVPFQ